MAENSLANEARDLISRNFCNGLTEEIGSFRPSAPENESEVAGFDLSPLVNQDGRSFGKLFRTEGQKVFSAIHCHRIDPVPINPVARRMEKGLGH